MQSSPLRRSDVGPWSLPRPALRAVAPAGAPARRQRLVLPYLGGPFVWSPARRFRVLGRVQPGWYLFAIEASEAIALEPAEPSGLEVLPRVRGHLVGPWLFSPGGRVTRVHLLPTEQARELTPCVAHQLPSRELIFASLELLDDLEQQALEALDEGTPCPSTSPTLRTAYGFALLWRLCRRLGIPATPWGLRDQLAQVALRGKQGAFDLLTPTASLAPLHGLHEAPEGAEDEARLVPILAAAGATLVGCRRLGDDLLEARFHFLDRPFACVLERSSLRLIDAGLCLDGASQKLTLACLPAVLREAVAAGKVIVTRR